MDTQGIVRADQTGSWLWRTVLGVQLHMVAELMLSTEEG